MTAVHFDYLPPVKVWIPGPRADKVGTMLRDMRADIDGALAALRHTPEAGMDVVRVEVIAEALHEVTRPMRRAERAHVARWTAEAQARELGVNISEESTHEVQPGGSP